MAGMEVAVGRTAVDDGCAVALATTVRVGVALVTPVGVAVGVTGVGDVVGVDGVGEVLGRAVGVDVAVGDAVGDGTDVGVDVATRLIRGSETCGAST